MVNQQKISFCITCKGRLHHLKQTLRHNLENNADYPNTEFVVLDYDSPDNLKAWMKTYFQREMDEGKIRYAKYEPAPVFKMAHAKNMPHRLATGDIVCNLDADNVTGKGFASWLHRKFTQNPDILVRPHGHSFHGDPLHRFRTPQGLRGRVAVTADNFYRLRGYDEAHHNGYGKDDGNLALRARHMDLKRITIPQSFIGEAIQHSDEERLKLMGETEQSRHRTVMKARQTGLGKIISTRRFQRMIGLMPYPVIAEANPSGEFGNIEYGAGLYDVNDTPIILPAIQYDTATKSLSTRGR